MTGWTKLFSSIVTSSIWVQDDSTLRVWIAMLALADSRGHVEGSIPGFASLCRVTVEEMRAAIEILSSPDLDSRTPDDEGRRIETVAGGWILINYLKYREKSQEKDGSRAPYMRAYRQNVTRNNSVTKNVTSGTEERREKREEDNTKKTTLAHRVKTASERCDGFEEFWKLYPRKTGKAAALKAWKKHFQNGTLEKIRVTLAWEIKCEQWTKDGGQFIPHPATWLNQERWNDEPIGESKQVDDYTLRAE